MKIPEKDGSSRGRHALFDFRDPIDDELETGKSEVRVVFRTPLSCHEEEPPVGRDVVGEFA